MLSYCFIYNPGSNKYKSSQLLSRLKSHLRHFSNSDLIVSQKIGDITEHARSAAGNYDVVVACGGDGTTREVAEGLIGTRARMGIIPMGSGNDFSKSVGIPADIKRAFSILEQGKTRPADLGRCNDFYFINSLGFGFDGLTNRYASQMKPMPGGFKYTLAALKANINSYQFNADIMVDHRRINREYLMVTIANGPVEGGLFKIAPGADPGDGSMDLVLVRPFSRWILPSLLPFFLTGRQEIFAGVSRYPFQDNIRLTLNRPVDIHADGEVIDTRETTFEVQLLPSAISVIGGYK